MFRPLEPVATPLTAGAKAGMYSCLVVAVVQLNCCGVASPHDYRYSAWFNHSRPASLVYVPASCCFDSESPGGATTETPVSSGGRVSGAAAASRRVMADTQCQLEAILYPLHPSYSSANRKPYTLKTQVSYRNLSIHSDLQTHPGRASDNRMTLTCCLLYTSPSPRDRQKSRMPSSA